MKPVLPHVVGLVAHAGKAGAAALVAALCREFLQRAVSVRMEQATASLIGELSHSRVEDLGKECDLLMVLGGDGTILNTVHALRGNLLPIFGVNLGLLGFLTCLSSADFKQAAECAVTGKYHLSQRTLLTVTVKNGAGPERGRFPDSTQDVGKEGEEHMGLNEVVISRGALSRLVRLETRIDGELLTEYNADGLIVATPTGSTAYSLSAGGPILAPDSEVFAVTPICPHTLTNRSVIVHDHASIEVRFRNQRDELFLTVDGQRSVRLLPSDTVCIRRSKQTLPLAMLPDLSFFELIRRKLKWSGS